MQPTLHTPRLLLRPFTPNDASALLAILRDPQTARFLPWFPPATEPEARHLLQTRFLPPDTPAGLPVPMRYAVCPRAENTPIGYVAIGTPPAYDLGYGLHRAHWGQGLIPEACTAVIDHARALGIPYLTATHDRENPASGRVMQKLGMRYAYSYEERWQPKDLLVTFRLYQLNLDGRPHPLYRTYWHQYPVHCIEPGL